MNTTNIKHFAVISSIFMASVGIGCALGVVYGQYLFALAGALIGAIIVITVILSGVIDEPKPLGGASLADSIGALEDEIATLGREIDALEARSSAALEESDKLISSIDRQQS